jgi:hypothetical protein
MLLKMIIFITFQKAAKMAMVGNMPNNIGTIILKKQNKYNRII